MLLVHMHVTLANQHILQGNNHMCNGRANIVSKRAAHLCFCEKGRVRQLCCLWMEPYRRDGKGAGWQRVMGPCLHWADLGGQAQHFALACTAKGHVQC